MKQIGSVVSKFILLCTGIFATISASAQEVVSTYDIKTPGHVRYWSDSYGPAIMFAAFILIAAYLIYHYWANGKLVDDMS